METAENALVLLYDLCRLCLDEPGVINIFEPVDWSQDILLYTGVKVTTTDKFPQTLCSSCRDIMNCVKVLKEISTTNDKRLQQIKGIDSNEVLVTDSSSHLVIITSQNHEQSAPKLISVRKDLFDSSATVSSTKKHHHVRSSKKRRESPSSTSSPCDDPNDSNKASSSSAKKSKETPTSTSSSEPEKSVIVCGKVLKIHKYEFECEVCNKSYATTKKLYLHQFTHNKKFQCPFDACCKKFATKGDLQKHIRSHTGEKPYKCNLCEQSFTQNVTLKSHKEKVHNEPLSQS